MNKRRIVTALIVLVAVALAAFLIVSLIKPKAGAEGEETVSDVAVHVGSIVRATLRRYVSVYGTVEPEPAGAGRRPADAQVASAVAGVVVNIDCHEGQKVSKGTVLFRLDSRVADVALEKARKALAFSEANFERQKKLLPVEGTSQKAYQEAEQQLAIARGDLASSETDAALLRIQAPLDGTVIKINTEPGEAVELNTILAVIIDLDRLVAAINVPSREAALIKVGQPAYFEKNEGVPASVTYVGTNIDDKTDTVPALISIPAGFGFRPGQFLSARIVSEERPDCLAVPENAAVSDTVGGEIGVIVIVEGDQAVRKQVKFGLRDGGLVEVVGEGLTESTVIVTEDAYAVPENTRIHIVK
ncbi:MAG: efflux RND transporter periplasmic adaptor subunit [Candidatus Aminicenantes bacterium]|nr:efflux RND transporter periplasmic adaptor subunit [Candidatus Aminicenantes bacterium]